MGHDYALLDKTTGEWELSDRAADAVACDTSTQELDVDEARALAKKLCPTIEPEWVDYARSSIDPSKYLMYDGGKLVPLEWFEDESSWADAHFETLSKEKLYEDMLRDGLPRMPEHEKTLDLSLIDEKLLESAPSQNEITDLVAFLPRLYAEGIEPIKRWHFEKEDEENVLTMPWPEYDEVVYELFHAASAEFWSDYNYRPEEAARMLEDHDVVENATLSQIKTMITYCVRGERFCDGHWGAMIDGGHIRRLLERLAEIGRD
jgi:hypothetical protein